MSEAVDTRIVEAKFDSAQFEKGVDRTVKKLDELKKSLNLEEAGKSVAQLADKTKEATEKASSSLEKLENSFTNFAGMLRQKLLSGIADEIVGVFFKIKNGFESLVSSLSSAQVSVGMSKYEQMLTSVRTMIAAGDTEDAAYNAIETLGQYADQTSYSLDQMTSALSKMRAAGVDLDTGTKAVEGISNACAAAGVNATDASRAFFNLSQAYSSGYLKYTDYRSLELLNMTTEKFKIQMLDAAAAAGTLNKISDGVYQTVNKNDKKVSAGKKVTVKNLSDALKYNFMNTEAMNKLFGEGFFFDEKEWKKIKSEFKDVQDGEEKALAAAKERFGSVAVEAYFAAREARSFTDVMGTLKDVISRGWSTSFELIFGRLEEATKFFTALTESNLANAIYNISEFRNQILTHWSDSGGRDNLIQALENIDNLLGRILGHFTIFSDSEGDKFTNATRNIGHRLSKASLEFKKFTERLDAWFTEARIAKIRKAIRTIGNVLSTVFRALGIVFNFATKMFVTFMPILSKIIDNVDKVINRINEIFNVGKKNSKTKDGLDSLEIGLSNVVKSVEPLIEPLGKVIDFLGDVASFLIDIAAGSFVANLDFLADTLGFIIELFGGKSEQQKIKNGGVGVLDGLKNSIIKLGDACKESLTFVTDFFHNLYEDILVALGIHESPEGEEGGFFANVQKFFDTSEFLANIKRWFDELPDKINRIIYGNKKYRNKKENGKVVGLEHYYEGGIMNAIKAPFESVKTWITTELPKEITNIWNTVDEFIFGKKVTIATESAGDTGGTDVHTTRVKEGFSAWLSNLFTSVKDWFKDGGFWNVIVDIWTAIDKFLFGTKVTIATESAGGIGEEDVHTTRVKSGFSSWIANLFNSVKDWFENGGFWNTIVDIWNTVDEFLFGTKITVATESAGDVGETDVHTERVKEGFSAWLVNLFTSVKDWFENGGFWNTIVDIWKIVDEFLFGKKITVVSESAGDVGGTDVHTDRVKKGFSAWLDNIVKDVSGWFDGFRDKIVNLWSIVLDAIFDIGEDNEEEIPNTEKEEKTVLDSVEELVKDLGQKIGKILSNLPAHIVEGWNFTLGLTDTFFSKLTEFLSNRNKENEAGDAASESIESIISGATEAVKDESSESSPLLSAILTFGFNLKQFITSTIPAFITEAFEFIKGLDLIGAVTSIFDIPDDWPATLQTKAKEIGTKVAEAIRSIPGFLRTAAEGIKYAFTYDPELERIKKNIRDSYTDEFGNIINPKEMNASLEAAEKKYYSVPRESGLWKTIKEIFGATGDVIKDLGPDILNTINRVFAWIGEQLGKATVYLDQAHDRGLTIDQAISEKLTDKDSGDAPLYNAIQSIGMTIKSLIVDVIPGFIKSAVTELSMQIPNLLSGLFSEVGSENIGDNLINSILGNSEENDNNIEATWASNVGKAVQDRLEQIKNVFAELQNKKILRSEAIKNVQSALDSANAEMANLHPDEENYENRRDELNARIEIYQNMLNDLNSTKNEISEIQQKINDAWDEMGNLDAGADNFEKRRQELNADIQAYQEMLDALKNDYVDANKYDVSNINIVEDYAKSGEKTEKAVTSFLGSFQGIVDAVTSVGASKLGQITLLVAAIAFTLYQIKEMLSVTDEVEGFGYTAKWEGIKIAIMGIVAILGWVTYLAQKDDQTQIDNTLAAFDRITEMINKLAEMFALIAGLKMGGNVFEMIGDIFGYKEAKTLAKAGQAAESGAGFFTNLLKTVTGKFTEIGIFAIGSDIIGGGIESLGESLGAVFQSIGIGVEQFSEFAVPAIDSLASMLTKIDDAIQTVNKIADLLTALDKVVGVVDLARAINEDIGGVGNSELAAEDLENSAISVMSRVTSRMSVIYSIGSMLNSLSKGISQFDILKDPTATLEKMISFVSGNEETGENLFKTFIQTMVDAFVDVNWRTDFSKISDVGYGLEFLANALSIFGMGIADLDEANVTALDKSLDVFIKMSEALNTGGLQEQSLLSKLWSGDASLSNFGSEIQSFGSHMKSFVKSVNSMSGMGVSDIDLTERKLNAIVVVTNGLADAVSKLHIGDMSAFDEFKVRIEGYGSSVASFVNAINTTMDAEINLDRIQAIEIGAQAMADLMQGLGALNEKDYSGNIPTLFSDFMKAVAENLNGVNDFYQIAFDAGSNLDLGLAAGISQGEKAIMAAQALCDAISGTFVISWQIGSPSKLMELYGRFLNEGLANGIAEDGKPTEAAREMAQDVIDEAKSVLSDPKSSSGDKSYAQQILEQMFGFGSGNGGGGGGYQFGSKWRKEVIPVIQETAAVITDETEAQLKQIEKQTTDDVSFLGKVFDAVSKEIFGDETDFFGFVNHLTHSDGLETENYVNTRSKNVNLIANGLAILGDHLAEAAREYIPSFATLLLDDGLLKEDMNPMAKLFSGMEALADDIGLYSDSIWIKFAGDLAGAYKTAFMNVAEGDKVGGWDVAKALFTNMYNEIGTYAKEHGGVFADAFSYVKNLDFNALFGGLDTAVPVALNYLASLGDTLKQPLLGFASETMSSLYEAILSEANDGDATAIVGVLLNNLSNLGTMLNEPMLNVASDVMTSIYDAMLAEANGEDATAIVGKMLTNLTGAFSTHANDEGLSGEVANKMLNIFNAANILTENGTDLTPKIVPVLEISDDFVNTANHLGQLLGFEELLKLGEDGTWTVNATAADLTAQLEALKATDYTTLIEQVNTAIGNLQKDVQGFNSSLGSMKFIINGKEFAYTIGPDINEYLGYEDSTRGSRYDAWGQYNMES